MRSLTLLIVLTLCGSALLTGCDQEMRQPIMQVVIPPKSSLENARTAMKRVNDKRIEVHQKAEEIGDFSTVFAASETIFKEELGFRKGFWVDLVEIYRQENLENEALLEPLDNLQDAFAEKLEEGTLGTFYFEYIRTFDVLIVEYLRLSFEFPERSEVELLTLFRESVQDGEMVIIFP